MGLLAPNTSRGDSDREVTVDWKNGFRIVDESDKDLYYLRLRFALQFRYTFLEFDDYIIENADEDWSNFYMRRARLFADGNAPSRDWMYLLHVQLEPTSAVSLLDGYIRWQRYRFLRCQFGRMKIPYGLEFWQSGFAQNGVERTIFTAETDVDGKARDVFGNTIERFWPGGNAIFPVSGHTLYGTLFPIGGFTLYRSQGIHLSGDAPVPGFHDESLLQYWAGVFNGRDTQGTRNPTEDMLYCARLAYEPFGPVGLTGQGDLMASQRPLAAFLVSFYYYSDRASMRYDSASTVDISDPQYVEDSYDIEDCGFDLAAIFRYRGFSADLEFGFENFNQDGDTPDNRDHYDRLGGRVNLGYFILPRQLEAVFKWAYVERIHDNDASASLRTGLGLVETRDGLAVERNLQQYTWGVNYYLHGHNQKISFDYSFLRRALQRAEPGMSSLENQHDHRVRLMYQHLF
jgi:hypothetical protein